MSVHNQLPELWQIATLKMQANHKNSLQIQLKTPRSSASCLLCGCGRVHLFLDGPSKGVYPSVVACLFQLSIITAYTIIQCDMAIFCLCTEGAITVSTLRIQFIVMLLPFPQFRLYSLQGVFGKRLNGALFPRPGTCRLFVSLRSDPKIGTFN